MKTLMMVIFSLSLILSCTSVRNFRLVGVMGGDILNDGVIVEDSVVRIKIENYDTEYDVLALNFFIRNKSDKNLFINTSKIYLSDQVMGLRYPLTVEETFKVVASNKFFETLREEMRNKREISMKILRDGEVPPGAMVRGVLFYEPGTHDISQLSLLVRGITIENELVDFKEIIFQDEAYAKNILKIKKKKEVEAKNIEKKILENENSKMAAPNIE